MPTNSRDCRILVVDDEPELVDALCESLQSEGFEAVGFTDPDAALDALRQRSFDLMLSDLNMPGKDGIALLHEALVIDPDLVGLIMTGHGSIETAVEAMRTGATDFVLKPFRIKQSLPILERAMNTRKSRAESARLNRELERLKAERLRILEEANARLMALVTTDPLTGLTNRRGFDEALTREIARAGRENRSAALVALDVDHFKSFNDQFGHPAGDEVLKHVASSMQACCRESDVAARTGGEEFAILLPGTDASGAVALAERVRAAIESAPWPRRSVTVSAGVATLGEEIDTADRLVAAADEALYLAKRDGRNRVVNWTRECAFDIADESDRR